MNNNEKGKFKDETNNNRYKRRTSTLKENIKNTQISRNNSNNHEFSSFNKNYLEEEENYMYEKNSNNSQKKNYHSQIKSNSDISHFTNFALKDPKYEVKTTAKNENSFKRKFPKVNPSHHRSNSHNILF